MANMFIVTIIFTVDKTMNLNVKKFVMHAFLILKQGDDLYNKG